MKLWENIILQKQAKCNIVKKKKNTAEEKDNDVSEIKLSNDWLKQTER